MEFQELVSKRKSIRRYIAGKVEKADIEAIIRCAQMAPSWKNSQTGRYYVALSEEAIGEVFASLPGYNQNSTVNAAYIVTTFKAGVSGMAQEGMTSEGDLWGAYDLGLQNAYMILKASELGYGTLIMGLRDEEKLRAYFNIPDEEILLPVIAIGKYEEDPAGRPRKALEEILTVR